MRKAKTIEEKKKKIFDMAIEAINKHKLFFINDLVAFLPVSLSTFYEFFPATSAEMEAIKAEILKVKIQIKVGIRSKLFTMDNPTAMLALYRLVSEPEEHRLLNQQYIEQKNIQEQPIFNIKPEIEDDTDR